MKRWWLSFWFNGEDYRPLMWPPPKGMLGFWSSGERERLNEGEKEYHNEHSLCMLVEAETEEQVKKIVEEGWPESTTAEWRFCHETEGLPGDRFPLADWSKERI